MKKMTLIPSTIRSLAQNYISEIIEEEIREAIDDVSEEIISKAKKSYKYKRNSRK